MDLLFRTSVHILQWREKDLLPQIQRPLIRHGIELAERTGKVFLVNSLVEIALEEGADGAHLTFDQDLREARKVREGQQGSEFLLGQSAHSLREAEAAESDGADYVLLGPIFDPLSKESTRPALGKPALREAVQVLSIPVIALGGIDESNRGAILKTGVTGTAGITWLQREVERLLETD